MQEVTEIRGVTKLQTDSKQTDVSMRLNGPLASLQPTSPQSLPGVGDSQTELPEVCGAAQCTLLL